MATIPPNLPGGRADTPGPYDDDDDEFERSLSVSPLKMAAMQLHEMYTNLREAGFSKREALYLVSKMMTNGGDE